MSTDARIAAARKRVIRFRLEGLTHRQIADEIGTTPAFIGRILNSGGGSHLDHEPDPTARAEQGRRAAAARWGTP